MLAMIFTLFFFGFSETSSYSLAKEHVQGEPIWTSTWSEASSCEVQNKQTAPAYNCGSWVQILDDARIQSKA